VFFCAPVFMRSLMIPRCCYVYFSVACSSYSLVSCVQLVSQLKKSVHWRLLCELELLCLTNCNIASVVIVFVKQWFVLLYCDAVDSRSLYCISWYNLCVLKVVLNASQPTDVAEVSKCVNKFVSSSRYGLNCHGGTMLVLHKLCRIAWSSTYFLGFNMEWHRIAYFEPMVPLRTYSLTHSRVCKTLSVSMLDHAWSVSVSSDLKQQKFFFR